MLPEMGDLEFISQLLMESALSKLSFRSASAEGLQKFEVRVAVKTVKPVMFNI